MTHFSRKLIISLGLILLALALAISAVYIQLIYIAAIIVAVGITLLLYKKPFYGVIFLTFLLPFERLGALDIGGTTIRPSNIIAIVLICVWVVKNIVHKSFPLRPHPLLIPLGLFIGANLFALVNAPNVQRSIVVLLFTLFTISVAMVLPQMITTKKQLQLVISTLLLSMALVCLFGIYQFLGDFAGLSTHLTGLREQYTKAILGFPRVQSTALEPLYFANYLLLPLGIAITLFLSKSSKINVWHLVSIALLGSLNLILTVSRGGYIAFAVMVGILFLVYIRQVLQPRTIMIGGASIIIVVLLAIRFLNVGDQLQNFLYHVTNLFDGASYVERVDTVDEAMTIWREHPLFGIGPGSFGPYVSYHPLIVPGDGYQIVNNEYIELLAETGLIGLALYCVIILVIIIRSIKAYRQANDPYHKALLVGLTAAYIGIVVQYNTFSVLYIMHIWFAIGMIIVVQNIILCPPHESSTQ